MGYDAQKMQRERERERSGYHYAIMSNLAYQRERLEQAKRDLALAEHYDETSTLGIRAELHDAETAYQAVLAVARKAGLR
jgi:hypothetical protein